MRLIKPERLNKGDVVGIIAPASSPLDPTKLDSGVNYIESLGYRVELGKNIGKANGYLAGTDQERVDDLNSMFKNKYVKAIICLRGGYGAFRILDRINYKLIRNMSRPRNAPDSRAIAGRAFREVTGRPCCTRCAIGCSRHGCNSPWGSRNSAAPSCECVPADGF